MPTWHARNLFCLALFELSVYTAKKDISLLRYLMPYCNDLLHPKKADMLFVNYATQFLATKILSELAIVNFSFH